MHKKSTARAPHDVSKLLAKSKVFQLSARKSDKADLFPEDTTAVPPIFDAQGINYYVHDIVSKYLEKPAVHPQEKSPVHQVKPPVHPQEKSPLRPKEKSPVRPVRVDPPVESPVQLLESSVDTEKPNTTWKPVEKNEVNKKLRPSSSTTLIKLHTRFTGQPNADPVRFSKKHPTLELDHDGSSDDDGRYLFHRRKNLGDSRNLRKKTVSSIENDEPREMSSSSSSCFVCIVEKPEKTWHDTFKNLAKKTSPVAPRKVSPKTAPKPKPASPRKVIEDSPKVKVMDKCGMISKLETKSFPVMSIKEKLNSIQKVVSISIDPQEFTPLTKATNVHYFEFVHEEDLVTVNSPRKHLVREEDSSVAEKSIRTEKHSKRGASLGKEVMPKEISNRKHEKNQINRFLVPFMKGSDFSLEEDFMNEVSDIGYSEFIFLD